MKATKEQAKIACEAFRDFSGLNIDYMQAALQAVFDTFPTEPTPEQVDRAAKVLADKAYFPYASTIKDALKAAMTEPPPVKYPYAVVHAAGPHYALVHIDSATKYSVHIPDFMEFDYEKLEMRLKK